MLFNLPVAIGFFKIGEWVNKPFLIFGNYFLSRAVRNGEI